MGNRTGYQWEPCRVSTEDRGGDLECGDRVRAVWAAPRAHKTSLPHCGFERRPEMAEKTNKPTINTTQPSEPQEQAKKSSDKAAVLRIEHLEARLAPRYRV